MNANAEPLEAVVSENGPKVEMRGLEINEVHPSMSKIPPPSIAEAMKSLEELADATRKFILTAKTMPRAKGMGPHQDPLRCLAIAQNNLQTGFMWLRRAVESPKVF